MRHVGYHFHVPLKLHINTFSDSRCDHLHFPRETIFLLIPLRETYEKGKLPESNRPEPLALQAPSTGFHKAEVGM